MEWIFFAIFSIVAAMLYNFIYPKIAATSTAGTLTAKGYIGMTLVTAAAFFVVLLVASFAMKIIDGKAGVNV